MNVPMIRRASSRSRKLVQVETLLLERPHEPLRAPVALRLADERRRVREAAALDLVDEGVRRVLTAPVVAERHLEGDLRGDRAEGHRHPEPDRLEHRPAIADLRHVPAHRLGRVVIDRAEETSTTPRARCRSASRPSPTSRRDAS